MLNENRKKELRLTQLAIVVALFAILTAISIPQYEGLTVHAKIVGTKVAMMRIASAVDYRTQELGMKDEKATWPNCPDIVAIQNILGVELGGLARIGDAKISPTTGVIQVTLKNIDVSVDGMTLSLIPTLGDGGIQWAWGGTVPTRYFQKK
jgi:Tfp pilus assembly major pilin PilA